MNLLENLPMETAAHQYNFQTTFLLIIVVYGPSKFTPMKATHQKPFTFCQSQIHSRK